MAKKQPVSQAAKIHAIALRIATQVNKAAGKGLQAAAIFLSARVKEAVSEPAPRKRVKDAMGNFSYRATSRAIPGAPPRKLSGRLRQSVTWQMLGPLRAQVGVNARSVKGYNYPKWLELNTRHPHPFLKVTAQKYSKQLRIIMGRSLRTSY